MDLQEGSYLYFRCAFTISGIVQWHSVDMLTDLKREVLITKEEIQRLRPRRLALESQSPNSNG